MRQIRRVLVLIFPLLLLLLVIQCAHFYAPQTREARAARLIRASLPPGSSERQARGFLFRQGVEYSSTDSRKGHRAIFGRFPLVAYSSWGSYTRWGIPDQWLDDSDRGVGFYFTMDARGRMVGFRVYPPGAGPYTKPWWDLP